MAKLGISAYILWRIAGKIDFGGAFRDMLTMSPALIALLILLTVLRHLLQIINWGSALRINPYYVADKVQIFRSYMIGLPLRFAMPGGHAAMGKIFFISNSSRSASFWSTALERSYMSWGTWTLAALAALLYYPNLNKALGIGILLLCLMLPFFVYLGLGCKKKWRYLQTPFAKLAPRMMSVQIAANCVTYLQYWLILNTFIPLGWWQSTIRMALTQFSNSIPITFAGLGLRESFAIHFLKTTGISAEQAVSATLSLFIIQDVLTAVIGTWFLIRAKKI